jgi:hypothetical protein
LYSGHQQTNKILYIGQRGITSGDVVSHKKYTGYLRTQEKLALTKWSDTILNKNRKAVEARHLEN